MNSAIKIIIVVGIIGSLSIMLGQITNPLTDTAVSYIAIGLGYINHLEPIMHTAPIFALIFLIWNLLYALVTFAIIKFLAPLFTS